jgi:thioredoxin-related protein
VAEKATEMFCENMKMLLFENKEYKEPIFKNYSIGKILRVFM